MRRQFVLDKRTSKLLEELAADRAGNQSRVVREAIQIYAERDAYLEKIEGDPAFQRMMEESDRAIREGRVVPQPEVERRIRAARKKRRKK